MSFYVFGHRHLGIFIEEKKNEEKISWVMKVGWHLIIEVPSCSPIVMDVEHTYTHTNYEHF